MKSKTKLIMHVGIAMGAQLAVIVTILTIVTIVMNVAIVTIVIRVNIVALAKDAMVVKSLKIFTIVVLCEDTDSKANQLYNKPSPFVGLLCRRISNNTLTKA